MDEALKVNFSHIVEAFGILAAVNNIQLSLDNCRAVLFDISQVDFHVMQYPYITYSGDKKS